VNITSQVENCLAEAVSPKNFGPREQIFYGDIHVRRKKQVLVKLIGECSVAGSKH
jgi:hypothetical protein